MINLFFVEAPFQLVSAHEAAKTVAGKNILVIRKNGQLRNDEQLERILKKSMPFWSRVIELNVKRDSFLHSFSFYLNIIPLLYLKLITLLEKDGINVVAMGDFRSGFWRFLYKFFFGKRLWLLDDGIALLNFYRCEANNLVLDPALLTLDNMSVGRYFLNRSRSSNGIVFKTFMDLNVYEPFELEPIKLTNVFSSEKVVDQKVDPELVFFIGAKLAEEKVMSQSDYLNICTEVAKCFSHKKVVYFPHREELDVAVEEIRNLLGFEIFRPLLPLEFHVCQQNVLAGSLIGFSSAAICTLSDIYPDIDVHLIDLNSTTLDVKFQNVFAVCHAYIESKSNVVAVIEVSGGQ